LSYRKTFLITKQIIFERMMKDKADILQGILGLLWILPVIFPSLITVPLTEAYKLMVYPIITLALSMAIVYLREEGGLDIFGILSAIFSILGIIFICAMMMNLKTLAVSLETFLGPISELISIVLGVGLLLEAFDVIKPVKL